MAAAQHKLSRRALLAGACALPLARHCEEPFDAACGGALDKLPLRGSDAAIQGGVSTDTAAGLVDLRSPSARCARNDGKGADGGKGRDDGTARDAKWQEALERFREADREIEAMVHCPNQRVYDRALGRHSTALKRVLRAPAPDLAAAGLKLELIVRHHVFEASFAAAAIAVLRRDIGRFAALPSS